MSSYTVYDPATGAVLYLLGGSVPRIAELSSNAYINGGYDSQLYRIDLSASPRKAELKPPPPYVKNKTQITADGIDELELSGLPDPCVVVWPDGVKTEVVGGSIQYSVDYPGTYTFKLSSPIHLETEVSVEALAVS